MKPRRRAHGSRLTKVPRTAPAEDTERAEYRCPFGTIVLLLRAGKLASVHLAPLAAAAASDRHRRDGSPAAAPFLEALERYFRREDAGLDRGLLDLSGASEFQRCVYGALLAVGFGHLITYGELAARVGRPGAARAIGRAMAGNPVPIFVPCHRVVAAGGGLGGFSAGLAWKRALLRHEGRTVKEATP